MVISLNLYRLQCQIGSGEAIDCFLLYFDLTADGGQEIGDWPRVWRWHSIRTLFQAEGERAGWRGEASATWLGSHVRFNQLDFELTTG